MRKFIFTSTREHALQDSLMVHRLMSHSSTTTQQLYVHTDLTRTASSAMNVIAQVTSANVSKEIPKVCKGELEEDVITPTPQSKLLMHRTEWPADSCVHEEEITNEQSNTVDDVPPSEKHGVSSKIEPSSKKPASTGASSCLSGPVESEQLAEPKGPWLRKRKMLFHLCFEITWKRESYLQVHTKQNVY